MLALSIASALVAPLAAAADPAPPAAAADAKASLAAGEKAAKAKDWPAALAAYSAANAAQPSPAALEGIGIAQYELKHTGEAYDAYDQFLKTYGNAIGSTRKKNAEARLKELAAVTGFISIRVSEAGANVTLDGQSLGTTPVAALIRVASGPHKVQVTKDGFAPIEKIPNVAANGKEIVEIALVREARTGHLVVREKSGATVRVIIDGSDVGAAPYETDLDPGTHEVSVRNASAAAPAQKIEITKGKTTEVEMVAVAASAHLEVSTSDRQGIIFLDGKPVAEGALSTDVSVGPHTIAVTREGYERFEKTVTLADKQAYAETIALHRPTAQGAVAVVDRSRSYDGIYGGVGGTVFIEGGGNGNELETRCSGLGAASCSTPAPLGGGLLGWLGYAWHPVGIELFLYGGYDQTAPSATFDGTAKPGQNPLTASVPRVEQFYFGRVGGLAALRARVSWQSEAIRLSLAAGFGVSYKMMLFERNARTSDGLQNRYVDNESYVSPALAIDASVAFRSWGATWIAIGALGMLETAGQDTTAPASKNQYIGSAGTAYPIPTPSYHLASSTQFFLGPFVAWHFGP
jgi:hypothetical protein